MLKRVSSMELRKSMGRILNEVNLKEDQFIIERSGKPMAALVPVWILNNIRKNREEFIEIMNRAREYAGNVSEEVLREEVQKAINEVRKSEAGQE